MILPLPAKRALLCGTILLGLAVLIGAFGAHGLKHLVTAEKLVTFETGVKYHFYHGLGLILLGLFGKAHPTARLNLVMIFFLSGIILFSFNCYLYALTGNKIFAMLVPLGGVSFVLGWFSFSWQVLKAR